MNCAAEFDMCTVLAESDTAVRALYGSTQLCIMMAYNLKCGQCYNCLVNKMLIFLFIYYTIMFIVALIKPLSREGSIS